MEATAFFVPVARPSSSNISESRQNPSARIAVSRVKGLVVEWFIEYIIENYMGLLFRPRPGSAGSYPTRTRPDGMIT